MVANKKAPAPKKKSAAAAKPKPKAKAKAPVKKRPVQKRTRAPGGGAKTRYMKDYDEQAEMLCKLGLIDRELGEFFGVTEQTINNWKKDHPTFRQALMRGKVIADAKVASRMFDRAVGCKVLEEKAFMYEGKIPKTKVEKELPPDTQAGRLWLHNRQKEHWKPNPGVGVEVGEGVVRVSLMGLDGEPIEDGHGDD